MKRSNLDEFLRTHGRLVVSTLDEDGRTQMSLVVAAYIDGAMTFTTPSSTRKARNAARDPRVSALMLGDNFWEYVTVEGRATLVRLPAAAEELRTIYERIAGKPHPDWDAYDAAMRSEDRVVFKLVPERIYPLED